MTLTTPSKSALRVAGPWRDARAQRPLTLAATLLPTLTAGGCAHQPPAPWERGHLARPKMAMTPDPLQARLQAKVYTSK